MTPDLTLRDALEAGDPVFGTAVPTFSPQMVEVYGDLGLDFVWVDAEHTGDADTDATRIGHLSRAADVTGTELLLRLESGDPPVIRKALDAGVRNLLIPRVRSADEVEQAVRATRFTYDGDPGTRGIGSGRTSRWGARLGPDYPGEEDERVLVGVMLEEAAAVEELEDILAVPELGFILVGNWDLTISLGHTDPTDRAVRDVVDTITDAARAAGIPYGIAGVPAAPDPIRDAIDEGAQLVILGSEISAVRTQIGGLLDEVR